MKIAVIGSGGWGIAAAKLLDENGHEVCLWSFDDAEARTLRSTRGLDKVLEGVRLRESVAITTDISCVSDCGLIVLVTPSFAVRETCEKMKPFVREGQPVVILSKGFDPGEGHMLLSRLVESVLGGVRLAVLSGPSHAEEVSRGMLTAVTAAANDHDTAVLVQKCFMNRAFKVYTSSDIIGVQLGGAIKNVIAVASGISSGMGFGDNTRAMLITRGVAEVARLGVLMGGKSETFWGLSGIGDTIVTCTSEHSRNFRAGVLIGRGMRPDEAVKAVGATVEGYYATRAVHELRAGLDVYLPLCDAIYKILFENANIHDMVSAIFGGEGKDEF